MVMKGDAEMLTIKRVGITVAVTAFAFACSLAAMPAKADTTSDRAAALLVWPKIVANAAGVCVNPADPNQNGQACNRVPCDSPMAYCKRSDTMVQVANLNSTQIVGAHCFYINANSHCSNTGDVCTSPLDCVDDGFVGVCRPGWNEINFDIRLSPNQPLVWSALEGLGSSSAPLPHPGNRGTRVPPVPESPFIGELKCVQIDTTSADRLPAECVAAPCPNDLIGQAAIEEVSVAEGTNAVDPRWYNAVGLRNLTSNDGDGELLLDGIEYENCPAVLVLDHLFDGAIDPISGSMTASTELSLAPCSEDLLRQRIDTVTAQFLVFNEFEQRFSTSIPVPCLVDRVISRIDTSQPERSIFSAGVAGTVAGQTRIRGVNGGLLGAAVLNLKMEADGLTSPEGPLLTSGAAYNLNQIGGQQTGDAIIIP